MNLYAAYFNWKQTEIKADSLYAAKLAAIAYFAPRKKQEHMVQVYLAQLNGVDIPQSTAL